MADNHKNEMTGMMNGLQHLADLPVLAFCQGNRQPVLGDVFTQLMRNAHSSSWRGAIGWEKQSASNAPKNHGSVVIIAPGVHAFKSG